MNDKPKVCGIDFSLTPADLALPDEEFAARIAYPAARSAAEYWVDKVGLPFTVSNAAHTAGVLSVEMTSVERDAGMSPLYRDIVNALICEALVARAPDRPVDYKPKAYSRQNEATA